MGHVISAIQSKGGAGKSTLIIAIASLLAKDGERVSIIDTDIQRTAETWGSPSVL